MFLTSFSIYYRIMVGTIIVFIILRVQVNLQPYKDEQNNRIEILATLAGMVTLFCGILFVHNDDTVQNFNIVVGILLFMFNVSFILNWLYRFIISWNIKNKVFNKILSQYIHIFLRRMILMFFCSLFC